MHKSEAPTYIQDVLDILEEVPGINLVDLLNIKPEDRNSLRLGFYLSQELKLITFDPQTLKIRLKI